MFVHFLFQFLIFLHILNIIYFIHYLYHHSLLFIYIFFYSLHIQVVVLICYHHRNLMILNCFPTIIVNIILQFLFYIYLTNFTLKIVMKFLEILSIFHNVLMNFLQIFEMLIKN